MLNNLINFPTHKTSETGPTQQQTKIFNVDFKNERRIILDIIVVDNNEGVEFTFSRGNEMVDELNFKLRRVA